MDSTATAMNRIVHLYTEDCTQVVELTVSHLQVLCIIFTVTVALVVLYVTHLFRFCDNIPIHV
jgi:hypothetical protein